MCRLYDRGEGTDLDIHVGIVTPQLCTWATQRHDDQNGNAPRGWSSLCCKGSTQASEPYHTKTRRIGKPVNNLHLSIMLCTQNLAIFACSTTPSLLCHLSAGHIVWLSGQSVQSRPRLPFTLTALPATVSDPSASLCLLCPLHQSYRAQASPVEEVFRRRGVLKEFELTAGIPQTSPHLITLLERYMPSTRREQRRPAPDSASTRAAVHA